MGNKKKKGNKEGESGKSPSTQQEPAVQHPAAVAPQNPQPQESSQKPQSQKNSESQKQEHQDQDDMKRNQGRHQAGSSKDEPQNKERKMAPGDWICNGCNQHNFAKKKVCHRCKIPKPSEPESEGPSMSQQQPQRPQTYPQSVQRQPTQETRQPPQPFQPTQAPRQQTQSGSSSQSSRSIAPGEWICHICSQHNFAKKKVCHRCNIPKPADPQSESERQAIPSSSQQQQPMRPQSQPMRPQSQPTQQTVQRAPQQFQPAQAPSQQPQSRTSSQASSRSEQTPLPTSSFQEMKISSKQTKHSSPFIIESSSTPSEYEGKKGKKCVLEVNYGKITLDPKKLPKEAFHYDVTFDPETPKKFLSYALDELMRKFFPVYIFGSDNRKNIYTAARLENDGQIVDEQGFQREVNAVMGDRNKNFKVTVKYAGSKDMSILLKYNNPAYQNEEKPMDSVQALDVILRKPFKTVPGTLQVARGLYFAPNQILSLGDGMELWYGLFQSAIMGRSGIYLNVDVLHKAFPSAMPLLKFLQDSSRDNRVPQTLNRWDEEKLRDHLKMLTIGYRFNNELKTYGFNDLISPDRARFTDDKGREMSVAQYYQQQKGVRLQYPNLPYLWVGSRTRNVYLPLEFCEIPAGQATNKKCTPAATAAIIKFSATTTDDRKAKIKDLLRKINYQTDPTVTGFGINVDKNFQQIDGRVIEPPQLRYADGLVRPRAGAWNGKNYLETRPGEIKWALVNCDDRTTDQSLMEFKKNFMKAAKDQKLTLRDITVQEIRKVRVDNNFRNSIERTLDDCLKAQCSLVVVIIVDRNDCYGRVKQAAELRVGILTQCIKANTIFRMGRGNPMMTINNILLKVNAKLNGKNHEIEETSYKSFNQKASGVMFVGADVTHPSPDQRTIPSVVGVASSYDDVGFRYCCAWRLQDPRKEMIDDLENILIEHLQFYRAKNKVLPGKILYYRDGVSDGQFKEVLAIEMTAIKNALRKVYGTATHAAVTFIVVQKRHHTRFFPTQTEFTDGKFRNIMPGTVVDKNIIHPFQYQFFMASHAAIQGVTKPAKYCILVNESKIPPDDLQSITFDLCHLFTRCNRSVSYPAPTYYAHLVAARGKNYFAGDRIDLTRLRRENETRVIRPAIINNAPMFFV